MPRDIAIPGPVEAQAPARPRIERMFVDAERPDEFGEFHVMIQHEGSAPYCWLYVPAEYIEHLGPALMAYLVKRDRAGTR